MDNLSQRVGTPGLAVSVRVLSRAVALAAGLAMFSAIQAVSVQAAEAPCRLLYRQDFEGSAKDKLPEGWGRWSRADTKAMFNTADTEAGRGGKQCVSISQMAGTKAEYVLTLALPEGVRDVYATVWVKTALPPGTAKAGPLRLELSDPDAGWRVLGAGESLGAAADWRMLEVVVNYVQVLPYFED